MARLYILADAYIPWLQENLPDDCLVEPYYESYPEPDQLAQCDALITRTVTRVDENLITAAPNLKFVGSATAGFDHIDTAALDRANVHFAHAAGCNAKAVAEYVATAILLWSDKNNIDIKGLTLGIAGAGHAGTATGELCRKLGLDILYYDPPKSALDPGFESIPETDLLTADILSFHMPLDQYPKYPSFHWLNEQKLRICEAKLIINAARGGITDEKALLQYADEQYATLVTDVWENEPVFSLETMKNSFIATPHIAGYSVESKWRGTRMTAEALAAFFDLKLPDHHPAPPSGNMDFSVDEGLTELLCSCNPILEYDHRMRQLSGVSNIERRRAFARLRSGYPLRHEYTSLTMPVEVHHTYPILSALGIQQT